MWMMSDYQIGACIDCGMCQCGLITVRNCFTVISPVEVDDDQVCPLFFYGVNGAGKLCLTLADLLVNSRYTNQSDFNALDLKNSGIVIAKGSDSCIFQCGLRFGQTGSSIIFRMIVSKVGSFDRTVRKCGNIGRIAFVDIALAG